MVADFAMSIFKTLKKRKYGIVRILQVAGFQIVKTYVPGGRFYKYYIFHVY